MRLRSDMVVSALMRRVFAAGGFAAIEHKGMDMAGAIFVRQRFRDGLETLYAPAPQSLLDDDSAAERRFERRLDRVEREAVDTVMTRERQWDGDLWLVEIETEEIGDLLPLT
ncbi:DUF1491 family protein [Allorhizobium sp. BGMRC 0089]|uniref:DUF1491 family protein n=1 Tax=Allorhizobium sonneratiae TaxID=2934936 RepID=UPI00203367FF|nr:DUF1491 family protein [Allorhizobium sonneratiae]MCM2293505.1 DUF1491 family protein [Allorhizobium sonneratiae]